MMLTKGAIGNLINRYSAVLKKCSLINTFGSLAVAGMLVAGGVSGALATAATNTVFLGSNTEYTNVTKTDGKVIISGQVTSGEVSVFGGVNGASDAAQSVDITLGSTAALAGDAWIGDCLYGGGFINTAGENKLGSVTITLYGQTKEKSSHLAGDTNTIPLINKQKTGDIFGGGSAQGNNGAKVVVGNTEINFVSGRHNGHIFGGGEAMNGGQSSAGNTHITLSDGAVANLGVFGGGKARNTVADAKITSVSNTNATRIDVTGNANAKGVVAVVLPVFGRGRKALPVLQLVTQVSTFKRLPLQAN